jgi:putative ABC transport system ATP-binding protein
MALITLNNLTKDYGNKKAPIRALGPVSFEIAAGSYTVILGKSGSGKSTLLNLLAGLDKATTGEIVINNKDLSRLSPKRLAKYRSEIGIIFQFYNLLPTLNTIENIMMGSWAGGNNVKKTKAQDLLKNLGLEHREKSNITTLSGGEKQRVAIARALISDPQILFCDEPTGALDSKNEQQVKEIIQLLNDQGITIVMVTHNEDFVQNADQVIFLQDGIIQPYMTPSETTHPKRRKNDTPQPLTYNPNISYPAHQTVINP